MYQRSTEALAKHVEVEQSAREFCPQLLARKAEEGVNGLLVQKTMKFGADKRASLVLGAASSATSSRSRNRMKGHLEPSVECDTYAADETARRQRLDHYQGAAVLAQASPPLLSARIDRVVVNFADGCRTRLQGPPTRSSASRPALTSLRK